MTTEKITIAFDSSWAQLSNVPDYILCRVKQQLTYVDSQLEYSNKFSRGVYKNPEICLLQRNNLFYTGLIGRVAWVLNNCNQEFEVINRVKLVEPSMAVDLPSWLYDHQEDMLSKVLEVKRGICQSPTGSGKSITIAQLIRFFPTENILITVPEKSLLKQLKKTIEEATGEVLGEVHGTKKEFKRITVGIINSLTKIASENPDFYKDIDVLICDECHRVGANFYRDLCLACSQADYKIGFSATAWREKGDDKVLEGLLGPILMSISEKSLIEKGILAKPAYISIPYQSPSRKYRGVNSAGLYNTRNNKPDRNEVYNACVVKNHNRNSMIVDLVESYLNSGSELACMVLVHIVEHGEALQELFRQRGLELPFISGSTKVKDRRAAVADIMSGKLKAVIASSVFNEGQDIPRLGFGILAGGGSSKSKIIQQVGRFIRKYPNKEYGVIVDIADNEEFYLQTNHSVRVQKIKTTYPHSTITLNINQVIDLANNGFTDIKNTILPCTVS